MTPQFEITLDDQIREVQAELHIRRTAFPAWVRNNRMRQEVADKKYAAMTAALSTLVAIKQRGDVPPDLREPQKKEGLMR